MEQKVKFVLERLFEALSVRNSSEFCEMYKIKPNTLSTWKKRGTIPYDLILTISQNANISLDYIFGLNPKKEVQRLPSGLDDQETELLNSYRKLSIKKKEIYLFRIKADAIEAEEGV
ncbi:helix-turn-helix domain-containing protein [Wolinella succinogenes]|uniref:helix-turn-helix domain-containing protein n=1 Tax=Wolinella succinogenes TaxID=844 RepID=UPI0005A16CAC|nr:helix-turn-helix domain-containing protein [Wolinella succinogenes]VEG82409.1 Bacteriophage CI repressor helix-turn-helix domain [Wolinella succinogenes]